MYPELHAALARQKEAEITRRTRATRPAVRSQAPSKGRRTRTPLRALRFDG